MILFHYKYAEIPEGVYTLEDLKTLGEEREWCPYFMTRHLLNHATIVVYNYQYMLDPKVGRAQTILFLILTPVNADADADAFLVMQQLLERI